MVSNLPKVSVVMPVYNAEEYLKESVESILNQDFDDFEFVIINDASTDDSRAILEDYAKRDSRIRLEHNQQNLKIVKSLNKALKVARAPLVARMDADDISLPSRLGIQLKFMQDNPEVKVCGTFYQLIGSKEIQRPPVDHESIVAMLLFASALAHPSVMYRREYILSHGGYSEEFVYCEDYELWARLSLEKDCKFANIPLALLQYRGSGTALNTENHRLQVANVNKVHEFLLKNTGIRPTSEDMICHWNCTGFVPHLSKKAMFATNRWLTKLTKLNDELKLYETSAFLKEISCRSELLSCIYCDTFLKRTNKKIRRLASRIIKILT